MSPDNTKFKYRHLPRERRLRAAIIDILDRDFSLRLPPTPDMFRALRCTYNDWLYGTDFHAGHFPECES